MWKYIPNVGKEQSSIWWLNGNPEGGGLGFESDICYTFPGALHVCTVHENLTTFYNKIYFVETHYKNPLYELYY